MKLHFIRLCSLGLDGMKWRSTEMNLVFKHGVDSRKCLYFSFFQSFLPIILIIFF